MTIKKGDHIKVDYEGSLDDGTVFDSSKHGDHSHPLEFEVGSGQVIQGFDDAVVGMKKGEEKEMIIEAKDAYGEYRSELTKEFPRNELPKDDRIKEGVTIMLGNPQGQQFPAMIKKLTADTITLDLNHPLAGNRLHFKIKITEIN